MASRSTKGVQPGPDVHARGVEDVGTDGREPGEPSVRRARELLLVHRLDPEQGACAGCGSACPCPKANAAAAVIVAAGAWNTLGFEGPLSGGRPAGRAAETAVGLRAWARRAVRVIVPGSAVVRTGR